MTERVNSMKTKKLLYVFIFFVIVVVSVINLPYLEKILLDNTNKLGAYYVDSPISFIAIFFITYIILTALSIPIALFMGLLAGYLMDVLTAVLVISFASSIGATISMLIVRFFFYDLVSQRLAKQFKSISDELNISGAYYLFAVRMSPVFPFFIINACFGLTQMRASLFYIVSQLGMLPATTLIVMIGHELKQLVLLSNPLSVNIIVYLSLLGLLPLFFKKYAKKI